MRPILIIDDDTELCSLLSEYLTAEGLPVESTTSPKTGIEMALSGNFDFLILDVMMPEIDGFEVLKTVRSSSSIPVLMLTAKGDDIDRIVGLEMGADDYVPKPFNPRELVARIKAIQRRIEQRGGISGSNQNAIQFAGDLTLNHKAITLTQNGKKVDLTNVEFAILHELLQNAGKTVSREELAQKALDRELSLFDRSVDVHIANIRKKIGHCYQGNERIRTVRGVGYLYTAW